MSKKLLGGARKCQKTHLVGARKCQKKILGGARKCQKKPPRGRSFLRELVKKTEYFTIRVYPHPLSPQPPSP